MNINNGCSSMDEVLVVSDTDLPIAAAGNPDTLNCNQFVVNLDGTASSMEYSRREYSFWRNIFDASS